MSRSGGTLEKDRGRAAFFRCEPTSLPEQPRAAVYFAIQHLQPFRLPPRSGIYLGFFYLCQSQPTRPGDAGESSTFIIVVHDRLQQLFGLNSRNPGIGDDNGPPR